MWIARSTSLPAGAGPSATSCGSIPRACKSAGIARSANRISSRRSIHVALVAPRRLVEVRPQPALRLLDRNAAPLRIIIQLVAADPRDAEILGVAVAEVEARHGRSGKHGEI